MRPAGVAGRPRFSSGSEYAGISDRLAAVERKLAEHRGAIAILERERRALSRQLDRVAGTQEARL